jgi:hypothetical protein
MKWGGIRLSSHLSCCYEAAKEFIHQALHSAFRDHNGLLSFVLGQSATNQESRNNKNEQEVRQMTTLAAK